MKNAQVGTSVVGAIALKLVLLAAIITVQMTETTAISRVGTR